VQKGDATEIGERGINLSGGQQVLAARQRYKQSLPSQAESTLRYADKCACP